MDIEELKNKLQQYKPGQITFNDPHFTNQLILREGSKESVISNILNPENLFAFDEEKGKFGDIIYSLYFKVSRKRTMKLPVILNDKKGLYVLTYIMRYR